MNCSLTNRKAIGHRVDSARVPAIQATIHVSRQIRQEYDSIIIRANALPSCGVFAVNQNRLDIIWDRPEARKIGWADGLSQHRFDVRLYAIHNREKHFQEK